MAAPKGAYLPKKQSILDWLFDKGELQKDANGNYIPFASYYGYQKARSRSLGYGSYNAERKAVKKRKDEEEEQAKRRQRGVSPPIRITAEQYEGQRLLRLLESEHERLGYNSKEAGGLLARYLEWKGIRPPRADYAVGETP